MSEFKGTSGKWFACCSAKKPHFIFSENGEVTICAPIQRQEMCNDLSDEEFKANALLISKAPELLERLKIMYDFYETLAIKINSDDFDEEFRAKWNYLMSETEQLIAKSTLNQ